MLGGRSFYVSLLLMLLMCWPDKWAALIWIIHRRFDRLPQDSIRSPSDDGKLKRPVEKMLCHKRREPFIFAMWTGLYCIRFNWVSRWCQEVRCHLCSLKMHLRKNKIRWLSVRSLFWSFSGSFWLCTSPLSALWYSYSKYTFLLGVFRLNSSLLYPADSCSNLKECLNKICTLPCCLSSESNVSLQSADLPVGQAWVAGQLLTFC